MKIRLDIQEQQLDEFELEASVLTEKTLIADLLTVGVDADFL